MKISTPADVGALIRDRRGVLHMTQADLAGRTGVSVRWLVDVERGKRSAEIGKVLAVLAQLRVHVDASATGDRLDPNDADGAKQVPSVLDLDTYLDGLAT